jgi:chaperone required for assembly of F1-ATPase
VIEQTKRKLYAYTSCIAIIAIFAGQALTDLHVKYIDDVNMPLSVVAKSIDANKDTVAKNSVRAAAINNKIHNTNKGDELIFSTSANNIVYFEGNNIQTINTAKKGWAVTILLHDKTKKRQTYK